MKYEKFIQQMRGLPIIEANALRAMGEPPDSLSVQLSRWVDSGRLIRLRRGIYLLPKALQAFSPPIEQIANLLHGPSYVSLERALASHGMIPETVPVVQSVTTNRPITLRTEIGTFLYRHVKRSWFFGYREEEIGGGAALMALPEKALLDLFYLTRGEMTLTRIREYRLEALDRLDISRMEAWLRDHVEPRLMRALYRLKQYMEETAGYEL